MSECLLPARAGGEGVEGEESQREDEDRLGVWVLNRALQADSGMPKGLRRLYLSETAQ